MKLSDAIRLGAMIRPQAFGHETHGAAGSCALQAAAEAVGIKRPIFLPVDYAAIGRRWPFLYGLAACPACDWNGQLALSLIWHLNDVHRWTREQIADWVAIIEPQDVDAVVDPRVGDPGPVAVEG